MTHIVLDAPIVAVTVFKDGARVRRGGSVALEEGPQSIVVSGLPESVDPSSLRVGARGQGLALLDVDVRREVHADPSREQVSRLRDEVDRLRDELGGLEDSEAAERATLDFLRQLSEASAASLARAVGAGRLARDELDGMAGHLTSRTGEALGRCRQIEVRTRAARRELEAAEQRLGACEHATAPSATFTVTAAIEAATATQATIELTYHTSGAGWQPLYDLVLRDGQLTVNYLAEIAQQTGEDWPEVELALSTTRRGAHETLPELIPWYIGRARVVRMRAQAASYAPMVAGAMAEQEPEAAQILAKAEETEGGLVFAVQRPMPVPADGEPHTTAVARPDLAAALTHLTVPALAPEAYLRATVTNTSDVLLLPGRARIFRGTTYIGQTRLETVASGEEFELQLGADDQVRVERELRRRQTSKAILGGTRTIDIAYQITVANHRADTASVTVRDHIPVSTDGDIKVRLRDATPAPAEQTDLGELTWELTLERGARATIGYRFTVEHPAGVDVVGL